MPHRKAVETEGLYPKAVAVGRGAVDSALELVFDDVRVIVTPAQALQLVAEIAEQIGALRPLGAYGLAHVLAAPEPEASE